MMCKKNNSTFKTPIILKGINRNNKNPVNTKGALLTLQMTINPKTYKCEQIMFLCRGSKNIHIRVPRVHVNVNSWLEPIVQREETFTYLLLTGAAKGESSSLPPRKRKIEFNPSVKTNQKPLHTRKNYC